MTSPSPQSPMQRGLESSADFREYRIGWLEPAVQQLAPAAETKERIAAAGRRGPKTHALLLKNLEDGINDGIAAEWQHLIQTCSRTEGGLRCFVCGAGHDCGCNTPCRDKPDRLPFELMGVPSIGSSIQLCNLRSSEGQRLNGLRGEVVSLKEGGTARLGVRIHGQPINKAIKLDNVRLTLLSQSQAASHPAQGIQWRDQEPQGTLGS